MTEEVKTTEEQVSNVNDYKAIIKKYIDNGSSRFNGFKVRTVGVKQIMSDSGFEYANITLNVFGDGVRAFVQNEEGEFVKGKSKTIFTSSFAISGIFKEYEELAWVAKDIVAKPEMLEVLLSGAIVDVLSTEVAAGEVYKNPFSKNKNESAYGHDTIINEVISIKLSKTAMEDLQMVKRSKLLGK